MDATKVHQCKIKKKIILRLHRKCEKNKKSLKICTEMKNLKVMQKMETRTNRFDAEQTQEIRNGCR